LCDFRQFSAKKWRFLKNQCYDQNFAYFSFVLSQKRQFFRRIFRRKYFKNHNIGPWRKMLFGKNLTWLTKFACEQKFDFRFRETFCHRRDATFVLTNFVLFVLTNLPIRRFDKKCSTLSKNNYFSIFCLFGTNFCAYLSSHITYTLKKFVLPNFFLYILIFTYFLADLSQTKFLLAIFQTNYSVKIFVN
jgi:hypothetical protein